VLNARDFHYDRAMNEDVMVVNTSDLVPHIAGRAFDVIRENSGAILELIASKHFFIPRPKAEVSPQYRQVIPYVVITHRDDVFTLRRTKKQHEARLHDKISIGIGGHINPGHDVMAGLRKELEEEVAVEEPFTLDFVGILNDESTEVSRVHLGAVYLLQASSANVHVRETEKMTGSWNSRRDLASMRDAMESWSQIVFDQVLSR
jgi:predicted NUDIX family phosphoesterase